MTKPLSEPVTNTLPKPVSMLILGAGWTSTFLLPLLSRERITHAATTTTGRDGTLKFKFDPASDSLEPYQILPTAETILITFPLIGKGQSAKLLKQYSETHPDAKPNWIQLGSTGIFSIPNQTLWVTRHSSYDTTNPRAIAEDELLALGGCVLNLSGLWGSTRQPRNWIDRVAKTKEQLEGKESLHIVHGMDVARAVVAVSRAFTAGERWMLTDLMVYDWWALILGWAGGIEEGNGNAEEAKPLPQLKWIQELIAENGVQALPRAAERLGRCYDSREFWDTFKIMPVKARL